MTGKRALLSAGSTHTGQALQVARSVSDRILQMPGVSNPNVPAITGHVQTLKAHAADFLQKHAQSVEATLKGVATYGAEFEAAYIELRVLASRLDSGDPEARQAFVSGITRLVNEARSQDAAAQVLGKQLAAFREGVAADARALQSDVGNAQAVVAGDQAERAVLASRLAALRDKIGQVEEAKKWAQYGGPLLASIVKELAELISNEDALKREAAGVSARMARDSQSIEALQVVVTNTTHLIGSSGGLVDGVSALQAAWQTTATYFGSMEEALAASTQLPPGWAEATLDQAKHDLSDLLAQAA